MEFEDRFNHIAREPLRLHEYVSGTVLFTKVPITCLHGTHRADEYCRLKERRVKNGLAVRGIRYLNDYPVITSAIPNSGDIYDEVLLNTLSRDVPYSITIMDGHHRSRFAPSFGIYDIPCCVLTLSQTAELYGLETIERLAQFIKQVENWTAEAMESLMRRRANPTIPQPVYFDLLNQSLSVRPARLLHKQT